MNSPAVAEVPVSLLAPALDEGLLQLRLPLDASQRDRLLGYLALLVQWNRTYNLTAIRDPQAMLVQHLLDCLAVIGPLRREMENRPGRRLLDVGSGAGLPGLVIAIAAPEFEVTCIDSVGKKTAFIAHAAGVLGVGNASAVHGRVEDLADRRFHVVSSRAFTSLQSFVESTEHLLASSGIWLAMKGKLPTDELASLAANVAVFHVERLKVPQLDAERCIAWIHRIGESERPLQLEKP